MKLLRPHFVLLFIVFITFAAFYPSLSNDFAGWDDRLHLDYHLIGSLHWDNIKSLFTHTTNKTYIPLTMLSFAVEHKFFKYNAFGYHVDNLILHLFNVALMFYFCLKLNLKLRAAFLAALLFAIHPARVESVAWITERKDVLYLFFYLLSLHSYLQFIHTRRRIFYGLTLMMGILSMLAKPTAISLPLVLMLLDWFYERRGTLKLMSEKLPFFLLLWPLALPTILLSPKTVSIHPDIFSAFLIFVWSFSFYVVKFFFPVILLPMYQTPEPIGLQSLVYLFSLLIFVLFIYVGVKFRRNRWFMFCVMFYLCSLFYVFRFDKMTNLTVVGDRFLYLASIGPCLFLATWLDQIWSRSQKRFLWIPIILVLVFLIGKTYQQNKIWKDGFTMWNYVIQHDSHIAVAYNNRGVFYQLKEDYVKARSDYEKALNINPKYVDAYANLGYLDYVENKLDVALKNLDQAFYLEPLSCDIRYKRGMVLEKLNQWNASIEDYNQAINACPNYAEVYFARANFYFARQSFNQALADYDQVIKLDPSHASAYNNRGNLYFLKGDKERALSDYQKAVLIDPYHPDAHRNLETLSKANRALSPN